MYSIQKPARQVAHVRSWSERILFHFHRCVSGPWCPPKLLCESGLPWNCLLIFGSSSSFLSSPFCPSKRDPSVAGTGSPLLHFPTAGYLRPSLQTAAVRQGQVLPSHETAITVITLKIYKKGCSCSWKPQRIRSAPVIRLFLCHLL